MSDPRCPACASMLRWTGLRYYCVKCKAFPDSGAVAAAGVHPAFDADGFYAALDRCVKARGKTWLELSNETKVRSTVLVRLGQGAKPDLASLDALCSWAGLNAADYTPRREPQDRPPPTHLSGVEGSKNG